MTTRASLETTWRKFSPTARHAVLAALAEQAAQFKKAIAVERHMRAATLAALADQRVKTEEPRQSARLSVGTAIGIEHMDAQHDELERAYRAAIALLGGL